MQNEYNMLSPIMHVMFKCVYAPCTVIILLYNHRPCDSQMLLQCSNMDVKIESKQTKHKCWICLGKYGSDPASDCLVLQLSRIRLMTTNIPTAQPDKIDADCIECRQKKYDSMEESGLCSNQFADHISNTVVSGLYDFDENDKCFAQ